MEGLSEKYSPIKEARGKDEHSLEEDKKESEDDYTSVDASESTLRHKYSNAHVEGSGSKKGGKNSHAPPNIEDSMASSSYMMSSAGKDLSQSKSNKLAQMQGKTHI